MKKITTLLAVCTVLSANGAFAQETAGMNDKNQDSTNTMRNNQPPCRSTQEFAWGTAVVALAVLGTVVGLTVSQAN